MQTTSRNGENHVATSNVHKYDTFQLKCSAFQEACKTMFSLQESFKLFFPLEESCKQMFSSQEYCN